MGVGGQVRGFGTHMTSPACAVGLRYSLCPSPWRRGGRAWEGAWFLWAYAGGRSPDLSPPTTTTTTTTTGRSPWLQRASGREVCSMTETSCTVQERETSSSQSERSSEESSSVWLQTPRRHTDKDLLTTKTWRPVCATKR